MKKNVLGKNLKFAVMLFIGSATGIQAAHVPCPDPNTIQVKNQGSGKYLYTGKSNGIIFSMESDSNDLHFGAPIVATVSKDNSGNVDALFCNYLAGPDHQLISVDKGALERCDWPHGQHGTRTDYFNCRD